MFDSLPTIGRGHCVQKERPRGKIDNRCAGDARGIKFCLAVKASLGYRRTHITLPDNAAIDSVQRVHIVRFGHRNNHWAVWTALNVKWLRVNVAFDCTVKIHVARQICRGRLREGRIDIKATALTIVVILSDVDLRVCWNNCAPQTCSNNP